MAADAPDHCVARSSAAMMSFPGITLINPSGAGALGELGQYHDCWCPGSLRCQVTSSHDKLLRHNPWLTLLLLGLWENQVNTMAADALDPCVTRSSAAMILNMPDKQVCGERCQLPLWSRCWEMIKNANVFLCISLRWDWQACLFWGCWVSSSFHWAGRDTTDNS